MDNILEVKSLSAYYGPIRALFDVDFNIATGGVTAFLGIWLKSIVMVPMPRRVWIPGHGGVGKDYLISRR